MSDEELQQFVGRVLRPGSVNLQKYLAGEGGYPHWHSEIYPRDARCDALHRVLPWTIYLNDVPEAGETEFFYQWRADPAADRIVAHRLGRGSLTPTAATRPSAATETSPRHGYCFSGPSKSSGPDQRSSFHDANGRFSLNDDARERKATDVESRRENPAVSVATVSVNRRTY